MNMTQKAKLSDEDTRRLLNAKGEAAKVLDVISAYRDTVVEMVDKSSYREVARLTGLSTNTLQRWKREAGK